MGMCWSKVTTWRRIYWPLYGKHSATVISVFISGTAVKDDTLLSPLATKISYGDVSSSKRNASD
jgi:hypothetical protein